MRFIFEQIRIGGDRNFGYLIGDREAQTGMLVDPAYTPEALVERAAAQGLKITQILNTHSHSDHTNGNARAKELTGAQTVGVKETLGGADIIVRDGAALEVGAFEVRIFHLPGHCEDHILVWIPEYEVACTGDLLFVGKIGGTSTDVDTRIEWNSLQRLLKILPDSATLWPGHDYGCRPSTTVAMEKRCNPFLQCKEVGEFIRLKRDWPTFKALHGLK